MTEILQILLFFFIFTTLLVVPLNVFIKNPGSSKVNFLERSTFNLILNLNFLLLLSLLTLSLETIQSYVVIFYILILVYTYKNHFKLIDKFLFSLIPLFLVFFVFSIEISSTLYLGGMQSFLLHKIIIFL